MKRATREWLRRCVKMNGTRYLAGTVACNDALASDARLRAENRELRKAVQFALEHFEGTNMNISAELMRKALTPKHPRKP